MLSLTRYRNHIDEEVLAVRLTRENGPAVWEWAASKPFCEYVGGELVITGLNILHPRGRIKADFGDWVVRMPNGSFRPFTPTAFEAQHAPLRVDGGDRD